MNTRLSTAPQQDKIRSLCTKLGLVVEDFCFLQTARTQSPALLYIDEAAVLIDALTNLANNAQEIKEALRKGIFSTLEGISVYAPNLKTENGVINNDMVTTFLVEKTEFKKSMFDMTLVELRRCDAFFRELLAKYVERDNKLKNEHNKQAAQ